MKSISLCSAVLLLVAGSFSTVLAQANGKVSGTVTLEATGEPVHGAVVLIVGLGRFTTSDESGRFDLEDVPAGEYELLVQREHLGAERQRVTVEPEQVLDLSFVLALSPIHEEITVTTTARGESTALDVFNAVTTLDSFELAKNMAPTVGEVLEDEPGLAKRSFGPGSTRPIIRGFDGDRVLIMQDGVRTGDLSSQSADHGVTIDPASVERIEVVKGPATLLYGSNAIGGVVNTITPQDTFRRTQPQGLLGGALFDAGSANEQVGLNANLRYGSGSWMFWGGGGARRTDDYDTPAGPVVNSKTRLVNGTGGFGLYGDKAFFSVGAGIEDGLYGVPEAGEFHGHEEEGEHEEEEGEHGEEEFFIDLDTQRQNARIDFGLNDISNRFLESARVVLQYIDWNHEEVEIEEGIESVGTRFDNEMFLFRAEMEQQRGDKLTGKFGVWGQFRDYTATGEEALAPPTTQNALAGFIYEELDVAPTTTLQLGGRVEYNDYEPEARREAGGSGPEEEGEEHGHEEEPPEVRPRSFTGFSGSFGVRQELSSSTAFIANLTRSYRAPALEELYNFGSHVGNLAFEIGNPDLEGESTIGVDISLKRRTRTSNADFNVFYYGINDFVFADFTGEILDGLREAVFRQGDSRFFGFDGQASFRIADYLWLKAGFGLVDARLTQTDEALPRIPPLNGRIEVEIPYKELTVTPELVWATEQDDVFRDETTTEAYTVLNLKGSYVLAKPHVAHIFSVNAYNLTNELYRIHTSFIKDLAPEIGRGIKFAYSLKFF